MHVGCIQQSGGEIEVRPEGWKDGIPGSEVLKGPMITPQISWMFSPLWQAPWVRVGKSHDWRMFAQLRRLCVAYTRSCLSREQVILSSSGT